MTTNPISAIQDTNTLESSASTDPPVLLNSGSQALISYFRLEIGNRVYDQRKGQIIGTPYYSSNTGQHDLACIVINDPDDKVRDSLSLNEEAVVYIGFNLDYELEILRGTIAMAGRSLPDGLIVKVMDFSSEGKSSLPRIVESKTGESEVEDGDISSDSDLERISNLNKQGEQRIDIGDEVLQEDLQYERSSKFYTDKQGDVVVGESGTAAASREALTVGDEIVSEGNTIKRVSPDGDEHTGVTIDWIKNRSAFIGTPTITKPTENQLQGSGGTWRVEGWDIDQKTTVGAVVVVPPKLVYDSDQEVILVDSTVKLGDPIFPESIYFWGDATLGGKRLPTTAKTVTRIIAVAQTLDELNRQYSPNQKWQIISWFNPSGGVRHEKGDAVSFVPNDAQLIYADLDPVWAGGLAIYPEGRFIHLDRRQDDGLPKLRFDF